MKAILVANDHSETRDDARGYLESRGYEVTDAANGHARGTPLDAAGDVALVDLDTPANGHNPYVPIIQITGFAKHAQSPNGNGAGEYVDFRALRGKLSAALRARSEAAQR
jgi:CheY-like chemotaxis protein